MAMSTDSTSGLKDLEKALSQEPNRETMRKACEDLDRLREEARESVGTVNAAVDFVRDARDPSSVHE